MRLSIRPLTILMAFGRSGSHWLSSLAEGTTTTSSSTTTMTDENQTFNETNDTNETDAWLSIDLIKLKMCAMWEVCEKRFVKNREEMEGPKYQNTWCWNLEHLEHLEHLEP